MKAKVEEVYKIKIPDQKMAREKRWGIAKAPDASKNAIKKDAKADDKKDAKADDKKDAKADAKPDAKKAAEPAKKEAKKA